LFLRLRYSKGFVPGATSRSRLTPDALLPTSANVPRGTFRPVPHYPAVYRRISAAAVPAPASRRYSAGVEESVAIEPYDPQWPARFESERSAIAAALRLAPGSIHHVGSTAVPGLAAKPIIDILVVVAAYPPTEAMIAALAELGYRHEGESGVPGRHWFRKGTPRTHHVHVVPEGGEVAQRLLLLRDRLRRHPDDAREYERVKKRAAAAAAAGRSIDDPTYAAAKTATILRILGRAK
jgi:GrpB-like predicted nucleotidyltransferase (UPF0157 family)